MGTSKKPRGLGSQPGTRASRCPRIPLADPTGSGHSAQSTTRVRQKSSRAPCGDEHSGWNDPNGSSSEDGNHEPCDDAGCSAGKYALSLLLLGRTARRCQAICRTCTGMQYGPQDPMDRRSRAKTDYAPLIHRSMNPDVVATPQFRVHSCAKLRGERQLVIHRFLLIPGRASPAPRKKPWKPRNHNDVSRPLKIHSSIHRSG